MVLIFPRWDLTWLAPFALVPGLIGAAREKRFRNRFRNGWAGGTFFWFFVCIWIQFVLEVHGGMGRWGGWGAFVVFALLKALHGALFASVAGILIHSRWAILLVPALWSAIEYAHGNLGLAWIGLGFSWLGLGNAAVDWPLLPRLAPWTGVYGISFVMAMTATAIVLIWRRRPWLHVAPVASILLIALLPALPEPAPARESVQVLQTNIDTEALWTEQSFAAMEQRFAKLSLDEPAPLIVWPEAPAPFYPDRPGFRTYISGIAQSAHVPLLMVGVGFTPDNQPLNSAFLLDPNGAIVDRYDKMQLVPFGEYVPPTFGWVNRITGEAGDFVPGTRVVTFPVNGHKLGAFICYESAFPRLVRRFASEGAEVLLNLSNDGYFGGSAAREQHLALVRMRAIENARWILRATNDGITAMIDPAGRITQTIPQYKETSEVLRFNYSTERTFYTRYGDWFPWSCLIAAVAGLVVLRLRPQKSIKES
jgi:apolipoprotein N-acyltransferase